MADGTVREGRTAVAPGARAGDRTTAWLDGRGALPADPVTPSQAGAGSVAVGTVAGAAGCLALIGAGRAGHLLLMRRRYAQRDREWAAADPGWGQRAA
ncbi:hypothetical protein ACIBK8_09335 [Streptomyces sp. NPDC050161]|uniref:hypothetical protein n=1 Tax=Streptomyces sp. NPDC050161 TaxID=3365604 RepID=UPI00378EEA9A